MTVVQLKSAQSHLMPDREESRIEAIDGLRAVAVLAIILYHLNEALLPGGFVGVDIFFVISGFVVARSASTYAGASLRAYVAQFFRRRLLRIYPALLVVVTVTALACGILLPIVPDTRYIVPTGISALFGASNIFLFSIAGDYFADVSKFNPFTHTWSLGAEEQYYLIFPFLSWFIFAGSAGRRKLGFVVLVAAMAASIASVLVMRNGPATFYLIISRFWEPGLGFLLFLYRAPISRQLAQSDAARVGVQGLGLVLLLAGLVFADAARFPAPWVFAPALGTALIIASLLTSDKDILPRLLSTPPLQWIGRLSYSLYLWHWVVIVAFRWIWRADTVTGQVLALLLTVALSAASYALVESPLRRQPSLRAMRGLPFYAGFAVTVLICLGISGLPLALKSRLSLSTTRDQVTWSTTAIPPAKPGDCRVSVANGSMPGGRMITYTPDGCTGARAGGQLFIAGDSHAGAYWRSAYNLAARANVTTTLITKGGCPILLFVPAAIGTGCEPYRARLMQEIETRAKPGDTLFLSALYLPRFRAAFEDISTGSKPNTPPTSQQDLTTLLTLLEKKQVRLVLEAPKPLMKTAAFRCADPWMKASTYCALAPAPYEKQALLTARSEILSRMKALAAAHPGITLFDPFETLCPDAICTGEKDGKPLFYDTDHLTGYGNDVVSPLIAREVLGRQYGGT